MVEWLVAKYMPDLRRREPRNVGIVAFVNGEVRLRFKGEQPDGSVESRPAGINEPEAYRAWVDYWHHLAATTPTTEDWFHRRGFDNYWLERGGRLLSDEEVDPSEFVNQLYAELVDSASHDDHDWKLADRVDVLIREANLPGNENFHTPFKIQAEVTGETYTYPYAYVNGHRAVAARITNIGPYSARSRLWEFTHLSRDVRKIVFTAHRAEDRSVDLLDDEADVVDVGTASPTRIRELFLTPRPGRTLL